MDGAVPFSSVEEAWFWAVLGERARQEGARFTAGLGRCPRPCEPGDVIRTAQRLLRAGRLTRAQGAVLARYGREMLAPALRGVGPGGDAALWEAALRRLDEALRRKGIVA